MANKRKLTTAIVAGVTAVAMLLGGTFAWTSISQTAKNETAGIVNVGGRLHDDFNGTNKDVYVENFTDPLDGGQPIYARIKLTEYMEVGQDAGGFGADVNGDGKTTAVPVVDGTDINDPDTWKVHVPSTGCELCATEGTCKIHDHWEWEMGGQTTFMPTFNKDKDSLAADINGTYHGTDDTDKVYYDDYVVYTTNNTAEGVGVGVAENAKEAHDGSIYSVIGTAYYDDDADNDTNDHDKNIGVFRTKTETHTAKQTSTATVMTMQEWIDGGKVPGNYWVYDTDGWAYWANPIMPGEATGLLLSNIEMTKNPGEKCYYAINVVAQFATVGDWEYFNGDSENPAFDGTGAAKELLEAASQSVATVTVTNVSGEPLLTPGQSYEFSANVYVNGTAQYAASDFEWSVLNADNTVSTTSTIENGVLTVGADETAANLIVVAKAKDDAYLGALGMCSVAVDVQDQVVFTASFETTDNLSGTPYAVLTKIGDSEYYQLSFVRTTGETITAGEDTLNDVVIEKVYTVDENSESFYPGWKYELYESYYGNGYKISGIEFLNTIAPISTSNWFDNFLFIDSITFSSKFNTSKLKTMDYMFNLATGYYEDPKLKYVDMSAVDFNGATVDVSSMFSGQMNLVEISLPTNVAPTDMSSMFYDCRSLVTINGLNTWDVSECTDMSSMFYSCYSLETINGLENWDVSKCSNMRFAFYQCKKITSLDLSSWVTSSATNMEDMFGNMTSLERIDLSKFDTSSVTNMTEMFWGCANLTEITGAADWNVSSVTTMEEMFMECTKLELNCSQWNVSNVTNNTRFSATSYEDSTSIETITLPLAWQETTTE